MKKVLSIVSFIAVTLAMTSCGTSSHCGCNSFGKVPSRATPSSTTVSVDRKLDSNCQLR